MLLRLRIPDHLDHPALQDLLAQQV